jgi:uncharacterized protein with NRDE domain
MCLILFAINAHPKYRLIAAANRDEFFNRRTHFANFWESHDHILGGKDELSGGTWLGIRSNGKFIAVTNHRNPHRVVQNAKSRGTLSKEFLNASCGISEFVDDISADKLSFNGYNLLLSDDGLKSIVHYSNVTDKMTTIKSGIHGLSNAFLDTPWPKVETGKRMLSKAVSSEEIDPKQLIPILSNKEEAADNNLPNTGISADLEKKLSPVFISMKDYGTRCSTVVLVDTKNEVDFLEVSYNENGKIINNVELKMQLKY